MVCAALAAVFVAAAAWAADPAATEKPKDAAGPVGKNKTTVCETGVYNLMQAEAPALIHLGKDKTQQ